MALKKADGQKIWKELLNQYLNKSWYGASLKGVKEKLRRVRFTYGGRMLETKKSKIEKNYEYAQKHFPSLVKKFRKKRLELELENNGNL